MGDDGGFSLPANMTEEEVIEIVRELLGDEDMSDMELMAAYRSGMFQELCPDIAHYAKQKQKPEKVKAEPSSHEPGKVKTEARSPRPETSARPEAPSSKPEKKVVVKIIDISDIDTDEESKHSHSHHKKKKKKKHKHHHKDDKDKDRDHKREKERDNKSDKGGVSGSGQSSSTKEKEVKRERDKTPEKEKKKEPKPFSKYASSASHIKIRRWKPVMDKEHPKLEKKYNLMPMSIVCLDLLDLPILFHDPHKKGKNSNSMPLTSNLELSDTKLGMIRRMERDKLTWFKGRLTRQALKLQGGHGHSSGKRNAMISSSSSDDDETDKRRKRIRTMRDSSSDSSSDMVVYKKPKVAEDKRKEKDNHHRDRGGAKLSKSEKEAEAKKRRLEEIKRKAEKHASKRGTRILAWENKDQYFKDSKRKTEEATNKEKARAAAEKRRKIELQKEKLEKQKNKPSVSFQRILAQIDAANKEEAKKPIVQLKIPKISQRPPTEYKLDRRISVGDVAKEVERLLKSNVTVTMPQMPDSSEDLGEYTVKKIAWWVLKNEKDPPDCGAYHPELHDNDDMESIHSDDFEWPEDMSSINGCVSDPEGLADDVPPDPKKVNDPDWADDYCGEASLYGRMRREHDKIDKLDSLDCFKGFLRIKPGTNYAKSNFEVKCFLCNELIKGQRQLGAHIRSDSHKNNFRNYSLNMVSYEEKIEKSIPKKEFLAKLVEYSVNPQQSDRSSDITEQKKHQVGRIERARSDSPGPIIAGDTAANIQVHEMPIPDDISFASAEDYDISSDESLQNVRVAIRTTGRWNDDLERRWRTWRDEEAKLAEKYNDEREFYINEPERHPAYQTEWLKFWDNRCNELEAEGKDTENYNFHKEWMPFWLKRMQEVMKERVEGEVRHLKRQYAIDKDMLRRIFNISAEETKRKKKKKKVGKMEQETSSSLNRSDKVVSGITPYQEKERAPLLPQEVHQTQHNSQRNENTHKKDVPRHHHRPHHSSPHHRSSNTVEKRRAQDERREKARTVNRGPSDELKNFNVVQKDEPNVREKIVLETISPNNSDIGDSSNGKHAFRSIKSVCSNVSSAEPLPPGEEVVLGLGVSKGHPPQNPVLSKTQINELREKTTRELHDLKSKTENSSRQEDRNLHKNNSSKLNNHSDSDRNKEAGSSKNDVTNKKSKHSPNDNETSRDRDIDNISSTSSDARALQSRLKELREAIAEEESAMSGTKPSASARPKIKPVEEKLEDGEVSSASSSLADFNPGLQGVSTFINKKIPGLTPETTIPQIPLDNLSKNSLGYHLIERRKSMDKQHNNSSARPQSVKDRNSKKGHSPKHQHGHRGSNDERGNHKKRKHSRDSRPEDFPTSQDHPHNRSKKEKHAKWQHPNSKQSDIRQPNKSSNIIPSVFNNNSNSNVPIPSPLGQTSSWPQEDSWESPTADNAWTTKAATPQPTWPQEDTWESSTSENPWVPKQPTPQHSLVPEPSGNQIPVLTAATRREPHQPPPPHPPNPWESQQHWDGYGYSAYPPQPTDSNNYYR